MTSADANKCEMESSIRTRFLRKIRACDIKVAIHERRASLSDDLIAFDPCLPVKWEWSAERADRIWELTRGFLPLAKVSDHYFLYHLGNGEKASLFLVDFEKARISALKACMGQILNKNSSWRSELTQLSDMCERSAVKDLQTTPLTEVTEKILFSYYICLLRLVPGTLYASHNDVNICFYESPWPERLKVGPSSPKNCEASRFANVWVGWVAFAVIVAAVISLARWALFLKWKWVIIIALSVVLFGPYLLFKARGILFRTRC